MEAGTITAARKRAAVELVAREEAELRHTARRYSLCEDDAEDAYQRALEILLVKAPNERPRDLIRWTKTVVKHEALAIRRYRERMLSAGPDERGDPITRIAALGAGPGERTERREDVARVREALQALKPAELRSLTLLAAGCSYAEIGRMTGFSKTKINRTLAEGRERLRRTLAHSEDGTRCAELVPLLSAYCDGEASADDAATVREHLRACAGCRARMRSYRAAPAAAALLPALPLSRSLLERAQEAWIGLQARLSGGGGAADAVPAQVAAAGGARGAGAAALAKALAICAGTVGGAAACVTGGVAPAPFDLEPQRIAEPRIERVSERAIEGAALLVEAEPPSKEAASTPPAPQPPPEPDEPSAPVPAPAPAPEPVEAGAVEYAPPAEPAPPAPEAASASSGSAAGEFGP